MSHPLDSIFNDAAGEISYDEARQCARMCEMVTAARHMDAIDGGLMDQAREEEGLTDDEEAINLESVFQELAEIVAEAQITGVVELPEPTVNNRAYAVIAEHHADVQDDVIVIDIDDDGADILSVNADGQPTMSARFSHPLLAHYLHSIDPNLLRPWDRVEQGFMLIFCGRAALQLSQLSGMTYRGRAGAAIASGGGGGGWSTGRSRWHPPAPQQSMRMRGG